MTRLGGRVNRFFAATGLTPLRAIVAMALLSGVGYLIYRVGFHEAEPVIISQQSIKDQYSLETDEILESLLLRANQIDITNYFLADGELNALEEELTEFENSRQLNPSQEVLVGHFRFNIMNTSVKLMLRNKISSEVKRQEMFDLCLRYLDSPNEAFRTEAQFWVCSLGAFELIEKPSSESFKRFAEIVKEYKTSYNSDAERAQYLAVLVLKLSQGDFKSPEFEQKAAWVLSEQLAESKNEQIVRLAKSLKQRALFGKFDLSTLRRRVAWLDPGSERDLRGAIELLQQRPQSEPYIWEAVIVAYESFLANDKIEKIGESWRKMMRLAEQIEDPDAKREIQKKLARQKIRMAAMERNFDISGERQPDGQAISLEDHDFVVLVFCESKTESYLALQRIKELKRSGAYEFSLVAAFTTPIPWNDFENLAVFQKEISVATQETAKKYFNAFPADLMPYALLLDKSGTIIAANLQYDQIEGRIAKAKAGAKRSLRDK